MRSAKSISSIAGGSQQLQKQQANNQADANNNKINSNVSSPTSPICRCRVMYLGSSVPHITKDGLQGIQEPLRELYPDKVTLASGNAGIDSWLSVWSNGILIENVDENGREVKRFFRIDALHYCAAVKYVGTVPQQQNSSYTTPADGSTLSSGIGAIPKFLPLDSPHARQSNSNPPIFASILRRTTGIKVLECHAFICKREAAANALVRCCFHAYADTMYAKQIGADVNGLSGDINNNIQSKMGSNDSQSYSSQQSQDERFSGIDSKQPPLATRRSKSIANINEAQSRRKDSWQESSYNNMVPMSSANYDNPQDLMRQQDHNSMIRRKSINETYTLNCDNLTTRQQQQQQQHINSMIHAADNNLRKQQKLSKSMHHLNQDGMNLSNGSPYSQPVKDRHLVNNDFDGCPPNQSSSASCISIPNSQWLSQQQDARFAQQVPQPFYNSYSSRVPSYPPQNLIDAANSGGTLRSIRSMAANSIASTLLRSKKHAKAMSMAQLNHDKIMSFHQPHPNALTMNGPILMPPVPPMFLPNLQARAAHLNGSQTMKASSKTMLPMIQTQTMNFEAMTPKEMKKLLKKSAKYGIDPNRFAENGLPLLPLRPPPVPKACHIPASSKSGTMLSQSALTDIYSTDMTDMASLHGLPPPPPRGMMPEMLDQQPMKPILVKPNPEFLKSKAGKKWLKQQKEFKKLLPPHLDGLPIVFGPPPVDALEPATFPNHPNMQPPTFLPAHPGVPMMDTAGYYNPHPFYGHNGRASAASTMLRYSPHSQAMQDNSNSIQPDSESMHRNQIMYGNGILAPAAHLHNQRDYVAEDSSIIFSNNDSGISSHTQHYAENNHRRNPRRNHMVEQSVISLGDENEYDDEDEDANHSEYYISGNHGQGSDHNSRHVKGSHSSAKLSSRDLNHEHMVHQEKGFNQADDQESYSSGIYKRGHINERAFSYSIRQEHKSSGSNNSDAECSARSESLTHNDQECRMNHDNQHHQSNIYQHDQDEKYYHGNHDSQAMPVNELTARLENQLNMKSFANSRIKSHM